ncbi:MAG TPA: metallophosphoesterase family protein [Pyrinomonadaceae bacterium]
MRTIVHLSDLHFGRVDRSLLDPLISSIEEIKPDLIAVSGDLTQRARSHQFKAARAFLDLLPQPQIVVPGNHDVPLHNLFARFVHRLKKYRVYITGDLEPFYADAEIVVVGVNTARSLTIKGGRVNRLQVDRVKERFGAYDDNVVKIVVTHHPFDLPEGHHERNLVGRARMAVTGLAECGADLFLSGHLHVSHTGHTAVRYQIKGHVALIVQAGTTLSTRGRGEANSFNVLRVDLREIIVARHQWVSSRSRFMAQVTERFHHNPSGWSRIEP